VGNHYFPPPCWAVGHDHDFKDMLSQVFDVIGKSAHSSSYLFTGADMDNLTISHEKFKKIKVYALVTAGVTSNACRMSKDVGKYYEPGTINIILLTNTALTKRAMTRSIITATEAKTAALLDLDVRSSYSFRNYRATGTGTDNILVVQGQGIQIDNTGGHSKMGELIARTVYNGVLKAIYKQNGLTSPRNIFQRLKERNISAFGLLSKNICECNISRTDQLIALEEILLEPRYAGFIESSLILSDDYEKGLFTDLTAYDLYCKIIAEEIASRKIDHMEDLVEMKELPIVLKQALNALLNGIYYKFN
jgi:iron complex transport system substrate-binding protein